MRSWIESHADYIKHLITKRPALELIVERLNDHDESDQCDYWDWDAFHCDYPLRQQILNLIHYLTQFDEHGVSEFDLETSSEVLQKEIKWVEDIVADLNKILEEK